MLFQPSTSAVCWRLWLFWNRDFQLKIYLWSWAPEKFSFMFVQLADIFGTSLKMLEIISRSQDAIMGLAVLKRVYIVWKKRVFKHDQSTGWKVRIQPVLNLPSHGTAFNPRIILDLSPRIILNFWPGFAIIFRTVGFGVSC